MLKTVVPLNIFWWFFQDSLNRKCTAFERKNSNNWNYNLLLLLYQEQQKTITKRRYTKKKVPQEKVHSAAAQLQRQPDSPPVSPPLPSEPPVDCIVEERRVEVYSASLLDHEYTAGPGPFSPGGPRGSGAMAPGVFLTSRRHSLSPQNSSSYSPSAPSPVGLATPTSTGACQGI